jgi:hypothetical protein
MVTLEPVGLVACELNGNPVAWYLWRCCKILMEQGFGGFFFRGNFGLEFADWPGKGRI